MITFCVVMLAHWVVVPNNQSSCLNPAYNPYHAGTCCLTGRDSRIGSFNIMSNATLWVGFGRGLHETGGKHEYQTHLNKCKQKMMEAQQGKQGITIEVMDVEIQDIIDEATQQQDIQCMFWQPR